MKKLFTLNLFIFMFILPFCAAEPFFNEGLAYKIEVDAPKIETSSTSDKQTNPSNLINFLNKNYPVNYRQAQEIVAHSIEAAVKNKLEPELILAIIAVESTYNPKATSAVGAKGLMQIMPQYHGDKIAALGTNENALYETSTNIHIGSEIIAEYLRWNKGNLSKALLRYNGSSKDGEQTYAKKVLRLYDNLKSTRSEKEDSVPVADLQLKPEDYNYYSGSFIP